MAWCEANDVDYVFGLPGNTALHADPVIAAEGDACATDRALRELVELRRYAETRYAAKSWGTTKRRVVARIEASSLGLDIRFVVTSLKGGSPERIYDTLYCARGHAANLIKLHNTVLSLPKDLSSRAIAPRADRPMPTRCGSFSTPPPIG